VGVAECRVLHGDGTLVTSGLGSCVAVAVFEPDGHVGGLLHAMLPEAPDGANKPGKYVDSGLQTLIEDLESRGVSRDEVRAKLVGGSSMLDISVGAAVGERNVEAAKRVLDDMDVPLLASETGGDSGRSVAFCPTTGDVTIDSVDAEVLVI
jgi:chemotaxis protein CheD